MVRRTFWEGKKVFLTGHTGFKGGWCATWLLEMRAEVTGYALKADTEPSYFTLCGLGERMQSVFGDIRELDGLRRALHKARPGIVIHLAAQPLVRRSYREPIETFATNVMGTVHVLEAVRRTPSVRAVVIVTSDKCYENREWLWGYREDEPMGGRDPYSASKGCAELVTSAYRWSFFGATGQSPAVATVRAGNVIGGGDWGEDRLVADAARAIQRGRPLLVRNPKSVRPWQHVLEPLAGYLALAERLYTEGDKWAGAWNFGPRDEDAVTVADLATMIMRLWGEGEWEEVSEQEAPREGRYLKLDCSKARQILGWRPRLTLEEAVRMTIAWYRRARAAEPGREMYDLTCEQIREYERQPITDGER